MDDGAVSLTGGAITLGSANVLGAVTVASGAGDISLTENAIARLRRSYFKCWNQCDYPKRSGCGGRRSCILDWRSDHVDAGECTGRCDCSEWSRCCLPDRERSDCDCSITRTDGDLTLNAEAMRSVRAERLRWTTITLEERDSTQANVLGAVTVASGTGDISLTESDAIAIAGITRTDGDLTLNVGNQCDYPKRSDCSGWMTEQYL